MLQNRNNEIKRYMGMLTVIMAVTFVLCFQPMVRSYNTTMLALSYQYGFTSRSLLGTIYHILNAILPVNMICYSAALVFAVVMTLLFIAFLLFFVYRALCICRDEDVKVLEYLFLLLLLNIVTTYVYPFNFLRVDIFMIWTSMLAVLLLVERKMEWLAIPLSAVGVMFHQGYVFMYFNLILVLLFYQWLTVKEGKKKYGCYFFASFFTGSALFLWFELFSRSNGDAIFDHVLEEAINLSYQGIYHSTLLYHEVLGIDLAASEETLRYINLFHMPLFLLLILPYLILFGKLFVRVMKKAETKLDQFKYLIVAVGAATMLPDFLIKVDYGRWVIAVIVYYFVIVAALLLLKDQLMQQEVHAMAASLKAKPYLVLLLAYPMFLIPFMDVSINGFLSNLCGRINDAYFNLY